MISVTVALKSIIRAAACMHFDHCKPSQRTSLERHLERMAHSANVCKCYYTQACGRNRYAAKDLPYKKNELKKKEYVPVRGRLCN